MSKGEEKEKKKAEKKLIDQRRNRVMLKLRKHTLEGIMRDYEKVSKPLDALKRKKEKEEG